MAREFTWEAFPLKFITAVLKSPKTKVKPNPGIKDKESLVPFMNCINLVPDRFFVRTYRREIEDYFLKESPYLVTVCKALSKKHFKGISMSSMDAMYDSVRTRRGTESLYAFYLQALRRQGYLEKFTENPESIFSHPVSIDLTKTFGEDLPLYDYQVQACEALKNHFLTEDEDAGILMLPTGGGKTRVSAKFLLEAMFPAGYQILWLTHRNMLVTQAAETIYEVVPVLKKVSPDKEIFKMICISGRHSIIQRCEKSDDVIIASVQSMVRNLSYLKAVLSDKVIVVVDECHHTSCPSYRNIIREVRNAVCDMKLFGLTATPVRASDAETAQLLELYDRNIIFHVDMAELIARRVLSTPKVVQVNTNVNMNTVITLDEEKYIKKWGELPESAVDKMAALSERNELIVQTYLQNREVYGRTLIFALNAVHCISLCKALQGKGIRCDYVYSSRQGNERVIERFRRGELDVLVNINICSEGSDIPGIESVFLTRPTSSDVLLLQMIGRGMRGPACGGTEEVNIVDFHDVWPRADAWMNAEIVLDGLSDSDETVTVQRRGRTHQIEWAKIRDILDGIHSSLCGSMPYSNVILPSGWYDVIDEDGCESKVMYFESQIKGYERMWDARDLFVLDDTYMPADALRDFFPDMGLLPTKRELQLLMNTARIEQDRPRSYEFTERKEIDASIIADRIKEENLRLSEIEDYVRGIYESHEELIKELYGDFDNYYATVKDFALYPRGIRPLGIQIEEVEEALIPYDMAPAYDLQALVNEVIQEQFGGLYGDVPPASWTGNAVKTYLGLYTKDPDGDFIRINRLLNSASVPREAVKYVIYHELLHRDYWNHDKMFRSKEHLYPGWVEHELFLKTMFVKFDLGIAL